MARNRPSSSESKPSCSPRAITSQVDGSSSRAHRHRTQPAEARHLEEVAALLGDERDLVVRHLAGREADRGFHETVAYQRPDLCLERLRGALDRALGGLGAFVREETSARNSVSCSVDQLAFGRDIYRSAGSYG